MRLALNKVMEFTNHSVISQDGTKIGYRSIGRGPGIVLIQGAMGTVENFTELARDLSDSYTVYVAERRGRGISPLAFTKDYTIQKEVEDLDALISRTQAQYLFGLSSGGIIALQVALEVPSLEKIAVYEPAIFVDGAPKAALRKFNNYLVAGNTAGALVAAMKAAQMGPRLMNVLPSWLLIALTGALMRQEAKNAKPSENSYFSSLAPTLQYDFKIVDEMSDKWPTFKNIKKKVLLLGGSKSPKYLAKALDSLEQTILNARRVVLKDLDHGSAWNYNKRHNPHGNPNRVAQELRQYFSNG